MEPKRKKGWFTKAIASGSLMVPHGWLPREYMSRQLDNLFDDPEDCEHDWYVVASILSTVELQVQCGRCGIYSEVPDPTKDEWSKAYGAGTKPYAWKDKSRMRFYFSRETGGPTDVGHQQSA
ncbi:MAG: hypothetical protein AAGJ94_10790 [Pseudomonadota bacterium]